MSFDYLKTYDRYGRRSVYEVINIDENDVNAFNEYNAIDMAKIEIGGNVFTNYGQYQFMLEKSYFEEPKRNARGALGNINEHKSFITARLAFNFSIMSIDDYRTLMKLHFAKNEHLVKCYDTINNRTITVKMYFSPPQMAKLHTISKIRFNQDAWENWLQLVGVKDYSVEMIGTNNELDAITIYYDYNAPKDISGNPIYPNGVIVPNQSEVDVHSGDDIILGTNSDFKDMPPSNKYKFNGWKDKSGTFYADGTRILVYESETFYADWVDVNTYTLSFNYGLSKPMSKVENGIAEDVYDKTIDDKTNIGELPTFEQEPPIIVDGTKYNPYFNGGWYKIPVKDEKYRVRSNQEYWSDRNTIIYCLYDTRKYVVEYISNMPSITIANQETEYNGTIYLPNLYAEGYNFIGWYLDNNYKETAPSKMPPYSITLYGKWEKID